MSRANFPERIAVLGAGVAGLAVAEALAKRGCRVTVYDRLPLEKLRPAAVRLEAVGARLIAADDHTGLDAADLIVPSPGAAVGNPLVDQAQARGQAILAEIEVAQRLMRSPLIGVTGTNGKTTTVLWAAAMLEAGGVAATVAGNTLAGGYQLPLAAAAEEAAPETWIVAEISSFQLALAREFRPRIAAITNVTSDHLDRHGTVQAYAAAKRRLISAQGPGDYVILNAGDPTSSAWASEAAAAVLLVSSVALPERGAGVDQGRLCLRLEGETVDLGAADELPIPGRHTIENALMAALTARLAGAEVEGIRTAMRDFSGVADRLEDLGEVAGVLFVNNSMCTNVAAAVRSIEAYDRPVVVIAGGEDKGSDFDPLGRTLKDRARAVVTLGRDGYRIAASAVRAGMSEAAIREARSMQEAVEQAQRLSQPGDVVLLAPACASFDMFESFQHRGQVFRECVEALRNQEKAPAVGAKKLMS